MASPNLLTVSSSRVIFRAGFGLSVAESAVRRFVQNEIKKRCEGGYGHMIARMSGLRRSGRVDGGR